MKKTINPLTIAAMIVLAVGMALSTIGCRQEGQRQPSGTVTDDPHANWSDSAYNEYRRLSRYYNSGNNDSLKAEAPAVLELCSSHQQWHWFYASWGILAEVYIFNGEVEKGLAEAKLIYEDAEERNNNYGKSMAKYLMAIVYSFQDSYVEAVESCRQAVALYPKGEDIASLVNIYNMYVQILDSKEDYSAMDSVLQHYKELIDACPVVQGRDDMVKHASWHFHYQKQAFEYFISKEWYEDASKAIDSAEYYTDFSEGLKWQKVYLMGCRTKLAMQRKDYTVALHYSDREMEMAQGMGRTQLIAVLKERWKVLRENRRLEEALEIQQRYHELTDSSSQDKTREQLNELNKRFEVDELRAQQEREKMDHDRAQFRLYLLIATIVVLALVLFIYLRHRASKRLQAEHQKLVDAYAQLETSNAQLSELNVQLTQANARAEESSKMKTNFIQQISHEIRTPLNILSGFTQIITTPGMELDEATRADINRQINENTGRITGLVNKMLELSDAGSQSNIERTDNVLAVQIAAEAADASGVTAAAHVAFDIQMTPEAEMLMLQTHQASATRALTLLLDNARKFTRPAEATGEVISEEKQKVLLALSTADDMAVFTIEDTGIGVPPEEAEHIFDEFVQLNDYYDGTGIGLTVARSLTRRLGGDIVLDTSYSPGARFVMTLPIV